MRLSRTLLLALCAFAFAAVLATVGSVATASDLAAAAGTDGMSNAVLNADPFQGAMPDIEDDFVDPVAPETVVAVAAPSSPHPYVLFLAENSCQLRKKFVGARSFIRESAAFYDNLTINLVGGFPRILFFESAEDRANHVIDPKVMTVENMLARLANLRTDPTYYDPKKSVVTVPLSSATTAEEITELFAKFGATKVADPIEGVVPEINESDDDRPSNRPFDMDSVLADPSAPVPTEAERAKAAEEFAAFVIEKEKKDAEEAAEATRRHEERARIEAEEEAAFLAEHAAKLAAEAGADKSEL